MGWCSENLREKTLRVGYSVVLVMIINTGEENMITVRACDVAAAIRDEASLYEGDGRALGADHLAREVVREGYGGHRGGYRSRSLKWRVIRVYRDELED
jgi:hypothetical protein